MTTKFLGRQVGSRVVGRPALQSRTRWHVVNLAGGSEGEGSIKPSEAASAGSFVDTSVRIRERKIDHLRHTFSCRSIIYEISYTPVFWVVDRESEVRIQKSWKTSKLDKFAYFVSVILN